MSRENIYTGIIANDGSGDTLRLAATKINNNFTELYTQFTDINKKFSNTWVSPQTSNTYGMLQVSGVSRVVLPASNTANVNSALTRTVIGSQVYLPRNTQLDSIFFPIWNGTVDQPDFLITVGANSSDGFISTYSNTEWILTFNDGPITYATGSPVNVFITYVPEPQPWFDPVALGYTDFRCAKIAYHAHIDNVNSFNEVGEIFYTASDDNSDHDTAQTKVVSSNDAQDVDLNIRKSTDKLYYRNLSVPAGNLHIQWTGTVWTGKDR